jgi:hypothetical protein
MSRLTWNAIKATPVVFGTLFLIVNSAFADQAAVSEIVLEQTIV